MNSGTQVNFQKVIPFKPSISYSLIIYYLTNDQQEEINRNPEDNRLFVLPGIKYFVKFVSTDREYSRFDLSSLKLISRGENIGSIVRCADPYWNEEHLWFCIYLYPFGDINKKLFRILEISGKMNYIVPEIIIKDSKNIVKSSD